MNEIIRYQNDLNKLNFRGLTRNDMDVLMALCSRMKDQETKDLEFSFAEIKELVRYNRKESTNNFITNLTGMNRRLMAVNCEIIYPNGDFNQFVLFPTFKVSPKNETLTVAVNPEFSWLLNEMRNYTTFELKEFVEIDSIYAKNLYRLLKQFRITGTMYISNIEEFKGQMTCPEKYTNKHFTDKIIKPAVEALKPYFQELTCMPEYARKRGRPLVGYTFTFVPEARREVPERKTTVKESQKKTTQTRTGNRFNDNFEQRNYSREEMSELERKLLNLAYKSVGDTDK